MSTPWVNLPDEVDHMLSCGFLEHSKTRQDQEAMHLCRQMWPCVENCVQRLQTLFRDNFLEHQQQVVREGKNDVSQSAELAIERAWEGFRACIDDPLIDVEQSYTLFENAADHRC